MFILREPVCLLFVVSFVKSEFHLPNNFLDEGKRQYDIVNAKGRSPHYGSCWKNAVAQLEVGCKYLNENLQAKLALSFTDCFLQSSGYEALDCHNKDCLQSLTDRAFHAYTEFYTHTHSMCYYLRSQVWHEETEKTIDKLSVTSGKVSAQLEEAGKTQDILLKHQKESVVIQEKLLNNGLHLASTLQSSKNQISTLVEDFRTATKEHSDILFGIFESLSTFQTWALGEVSWIDSILFYTVTSLLMYMLTSTPRTESARLCILVLLCLNAALERYLCFLVSNKLMFGTKTIDLIAEDLNWWIWLSRRSVVIISGLILFITAYKYCNFDVVNHKLLLQIRDQNTEILKLLQVLFENKSNNDVSIQLDDNFDSVGDKSNIWPIQTVSNMIPTPTMPSRYKTSVKDVEPNNHSSFKQPLIPMTHTSNVKSRTSPSSSRSSEASDISSHRYNLRRSIKI